MAHAYHDVIAAMLVCTLCFVLVMGLVFIYLILRRRHIQKLNLVPGAHSYIRIFSKPPATNPMGLRRPMTWLAIKNSDVNSVQTALSLSNPEPCPLSQGLYSHSDQKLFVSPPISGWILVIGPALPDPSDDVDLSFRFLTNLSRKLGHVQYFKINSALNHHAWVKTDFGSVVRAYAWSGKTLWNQGELTLAEKELRLKCYDYCETPDFSMFDLLDHAGSNSDKIHQLAASWSINPESIDERFVEHRIGVVGQPAKMV